MGRVPLNIKAKSVCHARVLSLPIGSIHKFSFCVWKHEEQRSYLSKFVFIVLCCISHITDNYLLNDTIFK